MADKKISELTALTGANVAATDQFVIVDTSAGQTKYIAADEAAKAMNLQVVQYAASITQSGSSAPTATVFLNAIGQTMTWARSSAGVFTVTAGAAAFTAGKTLVLCTLDALGSGTEFTISPTVTSTTVCTFEVRDFGGTLVDGIGGAMVFIRVFP